MALSAAALAGLVPGAAEAALTPGLVAVTVALTTAGTVPAAVGSLVKGVLQAMLWTRIKIVTALIMTIALAATTGGLLYHPHAEAQAPPRPAAVEPTRQAVAVANLVDVPAQRDGILVLVGTEIKEGEKVPEGQRIAVRIDGQQRQYRRLRVGDKVVEGQLLARLDDRLARDELQIAEARIVAREADSCAAKKPPRKPRPVMTG